MRVPSRYGTEEATVTLPSIHGINIAARIEGLAEGGGICLSGTAYDQVENKLSVGYA